MSKHDLKYKPFRRRRSIDASDAGPTLKLIAVIIGVIAVILSVVLWIVPGLLKWFGSDVSFPWNAKPSPTVYVAPSPTPHPVADNTVQRIYLPDWLSDQVTTDYSAWQDTLLFACGEGSTSCKRLYSYTFATGKVNEIDVTVQNDGLRYPKRNDKFLVYLDAKADGGGAIRAVNLQTETEFIVSEVRIGTPRFFLEDIYLTWIERTAEEEYKLIVTDLSTGESATVAILDNINYGASTPSLVSGQILYADENPTNAKKSLIRSILVESGAEWTFDPGTYVHDPRSNGNCWAWMAGNHGEDSDLYVSIEAGTPVCIAHGIVDFGMTSSLVVYSRDETIFAYVFGDNRTYVLSETGHDCLLLMAENGYVIWSDITNPGDMTLYYIKAE